MEITAEKTAEKRNYKILISMPHHIPNTSLGHNIDIFRPVSQHNDHLEVVDPKWRPLKCKQVVEVMGTSDKQ